MPTEKPRFCITVDDALLKDIDNYRFNNRYNSRSQATLDLIRMGLEALRQREGRENAQPSTGDTST